MCLVSLQLAMPWLVDSLKEKGGGVDGGQERRLGGEKGGETAMKMLKKNKTIRPLYYVTVFIITLDIFWSIIFFFLI